MATVNKDFRVKNGLVVEGATGTIDGNNIITDGDTTDVLDEGTSNLYYTDQRVRDVLTGSSQENISITEYDGQLIIVAENGVEDSTTDDLDEGTTNLYYTDERVRDAVSAGDGLSYDNLSGEFSADLGDGLGFAYDTSKIEVVTGNGLAIDVNDAVAIDTNVVVDVDSVQALSNKELGTDLDADGFQVVNLGTPQNASDAATKAYVDAVSEGLHIHASVAVATNENIALSPAPATIDGVTLTAGMRVLVKDQTTKSQNGIYVLDTEGDLVRAEDHNTAAEVQAGDFVFVQGGTIYGATGWVQTETVNTLDTDIIEWTQFSGAGTFTAGNGLTLSGTEFEIDTTVTVDVDTEQTLTNKTIDGGDNTFTNIANESLAEDSITINSYETALGESVTLVTDDVAEGYDSVNLYFTDQRAVDALEAVVPDFQEIEINSVSRQVAATTTLPGTSPVVVYSFDKTEYRSAKFLVKVAVGTHTEISEILLTLDTSDNIAITEYAIVGTNGNLGTVTATLNVNDVEITYTLASSSGTATVFGTLIA